MITTLSFFRYYAKVQQSCFEIMFFFVSFIICSYALDENISTDVSSELYDLLMQKWQQNSYCFMSRTSANICSDNSPEKYCNVRFRCGKFPQYMLAEDQGLWLAAAFSKGGLTGDWGFFQRHLSANCLHPITFLMSYNFLPIFLSFSSKSLW